MGVENITADVAPAPVAPAAPAVKRVEVTDGRGRAIMLRKPPVLAQFRLVEALGKAASNETYLAMVMPLLFVGAIDGEAVPTPSTKGEVEALIQRLDEDGYTALAEGVQANFADGAGASAEGKSDA